MSQTRIVILAILQFVWIGCAHAKPAMFWFNDPVGPDETVLVKGADLNEVTSITVARLADETAPEQEAPVEILQANPLSLKFIIPRDFQPGIYRFTLTSAQGAISGRINLPTVYWIQGDIGDATSPGSQLQIFGRNIVRQSGRAQLLLVSENGHSSIKATLTRGNLWRGIFRVPDQISAGQYRMRLFNGDGKSGEWVDAGSIAVRARDPAPDRSFDIRAYGARGDGKTDSTRAIRAAIEAAQQAGGGIVYLPRGRYLVSEAIVIPPHVHLRGERTDLVNLLWPDFAAPPPALIRGTSHFSIEDMTIYASNHLDVISGGFAGGFAPRDSQAPDAGDIAIRRVRIRASAFRVQLEQDPIFQRMKDYRRLIPEGAPDTIRLSGDRIELSDCDILGSGHSLRLFKASNAVISGNILNNGRDGGYELLGSRQVIFENNVVTGSDLQATGGGISTVSKQVSASENIFMGGNTFKAIYGEYREAMTTDGPGGYYFGHAESTAPNSLTLLDTPDPYPPTQSWAGALVMVVNGHGAGQYGRIASQAGSGPKMSITLEQPLQIALDPTSEVTIVQAHENYLIIGNSFEDTGVAVQAFGTALGHVVAGNTSNRTAGFHAIGLSYGHFQPCWHIQFLDNHILEGNVYRAGPDINVISNEALIFIRANQDATTPGRPPLVDGVIVRGNRLDEDAHISVEGFSAMSPGVRDVIVEANVTGPSRLGLKVDQGVASSLARRNEQQGRIGR